jgi:nucleoside-diphosphate-sugar epimerase
MKLFVTGASGFIGSAVVACAAGRGHDVVALARRGGPSADRPAAHGPVRWVIGDVRQPEAWAHELAGVDAVVHLAAGFGAEAQHQEVTVGGTAALLDAMASAGIDRLVLVSSIAVYDYRSVPARGLIDESTPLEPRPDQRDPYVRAKLAQEHLVRQRDLRTTVLRPGMVYGPSRTWDGGVARRLPGGLGVAIGPSSLLKVTHVDACARAITLAAERDAAIGLTANVVDDGLPTQRQFAAALRRAGLATPRSIPVPYRVARAGGRALRLVNDRVLGGRARLPELLDPPRQAARYGPFTYSNAAARHVLGWRPPVSVEQALAATPSTAP